MLCGLAGIASAQVTTDGSVGAATTLSGPDYAIPETLGTRAGSNLFHSFGQFDVGTGESATFSGGSDISRVIGRVTGGASSIDGTIRSTISAADVYLINPNGITFGANASLDVPGAFHASTADELVFGDGTRFSADPASPLSLSTAAPEAFGFLGANPAALTSGGELAVVDGNDLSLSGGGLTISGGRLEARGGRLDLTSVSGAGTLGLPGQTEGTTDRSGALGISGGSVITISTSLPGGAMRVRGGDVDISDATLFGSAFGDFEGGTVHVVATGALTLRDNAEISARNNGAGAGGAITVTADSMTFSGGSTIFTDVNSFSDGATIRMDVTGELRLVGDSRVFAEVSANESGDAGSVTISAGRVVLLESSVLASASFGSGRAADIVLVTPDLVIDGTGAGNTQTGLSSNAEIGVGETFSTGDAGSVTVTADRIEILSGGSIQTLARASGDAGNLTLNTDVLILDDSRITSSAIGQSSRIGVINLTADESITLRNGSAITAQATDQFNLSALDPDAIVLSAPTVSLSGGSEITTATAGLADAGNIVIRASSVDIDNATISSETTEFGDGGSIMITTGTLTLENGATLTSTASGDVFAFGNGGSVEVDASSDVTIRNSTIDVTSTGDGRPGSARITQTGGTFTFTDSRISADAFGDFDFDEGEPPSAITVTAPIIAISGQSTIEAETLGEVDTGSIQISGDQVTMSDVLIRARTLFGTGNGGDVIITSSGAITITDGGIFALADSDSQGGAGIVSMTAGGTLLIDSSTVTSDTFASIFDPTGVPIGAVTLSGKDVVISGGTFIDAETLGTVDAGDITITGKSVTLDTAFIRGRTFAEGTGGDVLISADTIDIGANSRITTSTLTGSSGDAGDITLQGGSVFIHGDSAIETDTEDFGLAGSVAISGVDILLSGASITSRDFFSGVGASGNITITADGTATIENGARITTETLAPNTDAIDDSETGGTTITLTAPRLLITSGAAITTQGAGSSGGNINLNSGDVVFISDAQVATSAVGGFGSGGNVTVRTPKTLALDDGFMLAQAVVGSGGNMSIVSERIISTEESQIDATSQRGVDGTVTLVAADIEVPNDTAALTVEVLDVSALLRNVCGLERAGQAASSLVARGRGVLPNDGREALTAPMVLRAPPPSLPSPPSGTSETSDSSEALPSPRLVATAMPMAGGQKTYRIRCAL